MEALIKQIYAQARLLNACDLFTGNERTLDDIVRLFSSVQGLEFCMKHHFPNMATFRQFKKYNVERFGIYIDAGTITLNNPKKVILIGRTSATINCDTLARHEVYLLHGSKAVVNASKWAVVSTEVEQGCNIIRNTSYNAIVL